MLPALNGLDNLVALRENRTAVTSLPREDFGGKHSAGEFWIFALCKPLKGGDDQGFVGGCRKIKENTCENWYIFYYQ